MRIKSGASIQGLDIRMRPVLIAADAVWKHHGQELVVTAGLDGEHSAGSLHYYGRAVDFRTNYFDPNVVPQVVDDLREELKRVLAWSKQPHTDYDVVLEKTHIHVEYDPKE